MIFSSSAVIAPGVDRLRLVDVHVNPNLWSKVVSWLLVTFKSDQVQRPLPKFKKIQFFTFLGEIIYIIIVIKIVMSRRNELTIHCCCFRAR